MRRALVSLVAVIAVAGGCGQKKDPNEGLPAATDWEAPPPMPESGSMGNSNPHGGMDMNDPHAGVDMNDPHAGMDMDDPHGGMDPAMAGMQPPDPNRDIDPNKYLRGTIVATKDTADHVKPGAIMFLSVRPVDPTTGEVLGAPLAVDRVDINELPVEFELTEHNMMVSGTDFSGDVEITARVDGDGEARSKQPGDVEGRLRAVIPAKDLELKLDTLLQ